MQRRCSRIEQLNKNYGSQLLVSADVLREVGDGDHGAESLGMVQVKGPRRADRRFSPERTPMHDNVAVS